MSERPPQTLKDLVERVADGESRLALQALLREIERLQGEVAERDRALSSVRAYLERAFSMTFKKWASSFETSGAREAASVGDAESVVRALASPEHEADRAALAQSEAEEAFGEFCRRAFTMLEEEVGAFVRDARNAVPAAVSMTWDLLQQTRKERSEWSKRRAEQNGRDTSDWRDYRVEPLYQDIARNSMADLLEFVFVFLYADDYLKASRRSSTPSYDRYWVLVRVREIRNAVSHGRGGQPSFKRSDAEAFFRREDYQAVRTALAEVEADMAERRSEWGEPPSTDGPSTQSSDRSS